MEKIILDKDARSVYLAFGAIHTDVELDKIINKTSDMQEEGMKGTIKALEYLCNKEGLTDKAKIYLIMSFSAAKCHKLE